MYLNISFNCKGCEFFLRMKKNKQVGWVTCVKLRRDLQYDGGERNGERVLETGTLGDGYEEGGNFF